MNSALPLPFVQNVVLIGGGHTHALFLRKWGMDPTPGAHLTLINPAATPSIATSITVWPSERPASAAGARPT